MNVKLKVILWSVFYTVLIICVILFSQMIGVERLEAESELAIHRAEAEGLRKQYERENRVYLNEQRRTRDKAFVECVNVIGLEQCGILSDWVEPNERVGIPLFGVIRH